MIPRDLTSLKDFLKAAIGRSQAAIIKQFLLTVRDRDGLVEDASILIDHAEDQKLVVYERDFLNSRKRWETKFDYDQGIAGSCYSTREKKVYPCKQGRKYKLELSGQSEIKNMVCAPIMLRTDLENNPFGVACFHNNDEKKKFTKRDVERLEAYVDILALALHMPHPELRVEKNVFIVHGHDEAALKDLRYLLRELSVKPIVLRDQERTAQSLLEELEQKLRTCEAGFILVTPDDEGRPKAADDSSEGIERAGRNVEEIFEPRARENVIFETGLLFSKFRGDKRVAILLKEPAKLPSDLKGILYDKFNTIKDLEVRVRAKLKQWELIP